MIEVIYDCFSGYTLNFQEKKIDSGTYWSLQEYSQILN